MHNYLHDLNDLERATVVGGNSDFHGASRVSVLKMCLLHELDIYDKMNNMTIRGGNVFYGFAWSRYPSSELEF